MLADTLYGITDALLEIYFASCIIDIDIIAYITERTW